MLEFLHIRNLALIEDMALEFSPGINALTGETGAGKSFILKALGFVLGDKLTADIVRPGAERAQVEAQFTMPDKDLVLRRELVAGSGRSRFYINDSLSSQDALRELRSQLISHTSQHAQQQLLQPQFQSQLLEMNFEQPELLEKRDKLLAELKDLAEKINNLRAKQKDLAEKRELLEMQNSEIEKVSPKPGEEEHLEELRSKIRSTENAKQNYTKAMVLLHGGEGPGILPLLGDFERLLQQMGKSDSHLEASLENVESLRQELVHLSNEFRRPTLPSPKVNVDAIESRLFAFAQLKRKLKRTLPQILDLKKEIEQNLSFLDACALDINHLNKEQKKLEEKLKNLLLEIIPLRHKAGEKFSSQLMEQLRDLGFSEHVSVIADFSSLEIWPGINDERGKILWAPNPGQTPHPLDKIASGGELSRFLLGLNILGEHNNNLTYIFDEVDAGVGGLTLNKVSEKLQTLAKKHQIILITHWPQLAAKAGKHFQITKSVKDNNTFTQCQPLDKAGRMAEIARMAGGGKEGATMAKNLLN